MHSNPWSDPGFKLDLVCIILAPTLICAGIYLTLKHVARTVGPDFSRITPRLYTWIFIPFDVFCLCLQGVGGGVDAAASDKTPVDAKTLKTGNDIIIAGIALQVVNLAVFGLFSLDFFVAARKHFKNPSEKVRNSAEAQIWYSRRFRVFCSAIACAYAGILVRCIYRYVFSFRLICYDIWLMISQCRRNGRWMGVSLVCSDPGQPYTDSFAETQSCVTRSSSMSSRERKSFIFLFNGP